MLRGNLKLDSQKRFVWEGISASGKPCHGKTLAQGESELKTILLRQGIALTSFSLGSKRAPVWRRRIKNSTIEYFFSSISILLESGIDLLNVLKILWTKNSLKSMRNLIEYIIRDIEMGLSFSNSLKNQKVFSNMVVQTIMVGEVSGELGKSCYKVSNYLLKKRLFSKKIKQALLPSIITFSISLLLVLGVFIFIIPRFESILLSMGRPLPNITKMIFNISKNTAFIFMFTVFLLITFCVIGLLRKSKKYAIKIDKVLLKIPILGLLFHGVDLVRFVQALSLMHACGVNVLGSIFYSKLVINNKFFRHKVSELELFIKEGYTLEDSMIRLNKYFSAELVAIISIGERCDDLTTMLSRAEKILEEDLDRSLYTITSFINPTIMVLLGLFVLILIAAIYAPIFTLASGI